LHARADEVQRAMYLYRYYPDWSRHNFVPMARKYLSMAVVPVFSLFRISL